MCRNLGSMRQTPLETAEYNAYIHYVRKDASIMIDGTYSVEVESPLGRKQGTVAIRTEGEVAHAEIDAPLVGKQKIDGRAEGNRFSAKGEFKIMLVGKVSYSLEGEVKGDELHVSIDSSKGAFKLVGTRVK